MSISQSIDAPITTRDTVSMSGSLSSQNGNAQGIFNFHRENQCDLKNSNIYFLFHRWFFNMWSSLNKSGLV